MSEVWVPNKWAWFGDIIDVPPVWDCLLEPTTQHHNVHSAAMCAGRASTGAEAQPICTLVDEINAESAVTCTHDLP